MNLTAIVRALIDSGATSQMILAAVEADEKTRMEQAAIKRENNRLRQKRFKENKPQVTVTSVTNAPNPSSSFPPDGFLPLKKPLPSLTPNPSPTSVLTRANSDFEKFWENYPRLRRGNREKALNAYCQALKRSTAEEIYAGLTAYCHSAESQGKYAKGAAAWLNDDRWTNQYERLEREPAKPNRLNDVFAGLARAGGGNLSEQRMEPAAGGEEFIDTQERITGRAGTIEGDFETLAASDNEDTPCQACPALPDSGNGTESIRYFV